ncbi:MAG: hypothetical protein CL916_06660 [Deltaproteobacteria bacterium]|nr:hypothetical protein [Deltaproteobacteria bacterium]
MFYWFSKERCWKTKQDEQWIIRNPPRPEWAQELEDIPAKYFIPVWVQASSLNEIQKSFFWKSLEELQGQALEISQWLQEREYKSLPERTVRSDDEILNPQELQELEDSGWIQKDVEETPSPKQPSDRDSYLPPQHIQITEGGNLRFSARH